MKLTILSAEVLLTCHCGSEYRVVVAEDYRLDPDELPAYAANEAGWVDEQECNECNKRNT